MEAKQLTYAILGTNPELAEKYEFYPLVFETSGAIHQGVEKFLKDRAREAADIKNLPMGTLYTYMLKRLSCALQKGIVQVLNGRIGTAISKVYPQPSHYNNAMVEDQLHRVAPSGVFDRVVGNYL